MVFPTEHEFTQLALRVHLRGTQAYRFVTLDVAP